MTRRMLPLLALFPLVLIAGCGDFFSSGSSIASIKISPTSRLSATGKAITFKANGTTVNGDSQDVTSSASWSTADSSIATVSSAGSIQTVGTGTTTVTASQDGVTGSASLIVTATTLSSIAITPNPATGTLSTGTPVQFTATGTFSDGTTQDLSNLVAWGSSSTAVATISSSGSASLVSAGQTNITAQVTTDSGVVSAPPVPLTVQ